MKRVITLIFTVMILYSPYSHSNFFNNLIGKVSTNDVKLYDKEYTSGLYDAFGDPLPAKTGFKAKIQNLNQKTPLKEVHIMVEVLDCKSGCNNCITASASVYEALKNEFYGFGENTILRPYNVFQVDMKIDNETKKKYLCSSKREHNLFQVIHS